MKNVLIVEDEKKFQNIYKEYVSDYGANPVIAASYDEAVRVVDLYAFDMALIDISLDIRDDKNVDGLLVLEYLSKKNDGTHSIVITAQGTFKIARDAILRYGAVNTVEKNELTLDFFENKLRAELIKGADSVKRKYNMDWCVLKPKNIDFMQWDNLLLNKCDPGGIEPVHHLFDAIVSEICPLIPLNKDQPLRLDDKCDIFIGELWSRRIGSALILVISNEKNYHDIEDYVKNSANYGIGELIFEKKFKKVFARAYLYGNLNCSEFALK